MRILGFTGVAALAVAGAGSTAPAPAQTITATAGVVPLSIGRGRLVTLTAPMSDVFVADDRIADVSVRSPTQLYIFAKGPGETSLYATNKAGKVVYSTSVRVGNNIDSLQQMLNLAMPESKVTATTLNGSVLLTGTVATPEDAAEAERLVTAFAGDSVKVLSRLRNATPLQVNLQVKFAEVSKNFSKNIGVNLTTLDGSGGFQFGIGTGRTPTEQFNALGGPLGIGSTAARCLPPILPTGQCTGTIPGTAVTKGTEFSTLAGIGKLFGMNVLGALDAGERNGQVTTLANPNLTVISGETGSFLAGGEIPIPVSQGLGAVSVEYKQYGVSLSYTATVLADGRINLRVRPEVSQLSSSGAVTLGGTQIPALTTRRAETTVELGSGQSMMIGGLMQNTHNNLINKLPGAGDVPILGALFRSNAFQRNETELMIVITPYLVKPVDANSIVLPTDGYQAPTDAGRVFLGQLEGGKTGGDRPKPTVAPSGAVAPVLGAQGQPGPMLPAPAPAAPKADAKTAPATSKKTAVPMPGFSR